MVLKCKLFWKMLFIVFHSALDFSKSNKVWKNCHNGFRRSLKFGKNPAIFSELVQKKWLKRNARTQDIFKSMCRPFEITTLLRNNLLLLQCYCSFNAGNRLTTLEQKSKLKIRTARLNWIAWKIMKQKC